MTRKGSHVMLTCAAAMLAALSATSTTISAQQVTEARIRELIKQAAEQIGQPSATLQVPQTSPGGTPPVVRLTLDDAVKFALDRNLDIAVQRLNPEIQDIAYASLKSVYLPALTSTLSQNGTTNASTSQISGGSAAAGVTNNTFTYNGGLTQSIPKGGGAFAATINNFRQTTTNNNSFYNPQYQSTWSGAYTQPLLRNFRIDSTRQQLAITKLTRDISDVQLRATITNTLSNVRNAYWDYVFAVQSVEVAQKSVSLAEQLVRDNQTRVEVGTMAPIDVVQAQSQAATAPQNPAAAQQTMRTAELAVKRLIVSGTEDPNWSVQIDPVDRPDFVAQSIDVEAAVRRALNERTDLDIARKNIASNDVTLRYLQDQLKPQ